MEVSGPGQNTARSAQGAAVHPPPAFACTARDTSPSLLHPPVRAGSPAGEKPSTPPDDSFPARCAEASTGPCDVRTTSRWTPRVRLACTATAALSAGSAGGTPGFSGRYRADAPGTAAPAFLAANCPPERGTDPLASTPLAVNRTLGCPQPGVQQQPTRTLRRWAGAPRPAAQRCRRAVVPATPEVTLRAAAGPSPDWQLPHGCASGGPSPPGADVPSAQRPASGSPPCSRRAPEAHARPRRRAHANTSAASHARAAVPPAWLQLSGTPGSCAAPPPGVRQHRRRQPRVRRCSTGLAAALLPLALRSRRAPRAHARPRRRAHASTSAASHALAAAPPAWLQLSGSAGFGCGFGAYFTHPPSLHMFP
ncbi:MAG: hypothetical protein RL653_77 [Pseudomonadota bacterium]